MSLEEALGKYCQKLITSSIELDEEITKLNLKKQRMNYELITSQNLLKEMSPGMSLATPMMSPVTPVILPIPILVPDLIKYSTKIDKDEESTLSVQERRKIYEKMSELEDPTKRYSTTQRIFLLPEWKKLSFSDKEGYYNFKKYWKRRQLTANTPSQLTHEEKLNIYEKMYPLDTEYRNTQATNRFMTKQTRLELLPEWEKLSKTDIDGYYAWKRNVDRASDSDKDHPSDKNHPSDNDSISPINILLNAAISN